MIESDKRKLSNEDSIQQQKTLLETSELNIKLSNKTAKEIRSKCELLGEYGGWVISPYWHPRKDETWYDTWFWMLHDGVAENISNYFSENNYSLLKNINAFSRFKVSRYEWFCEAEELFIEKHFTSCAMLLTAILEESVRKCPIKEWRWQIDVFFKDAVLSKIKDYYNKELEPLNRYIETILLLPSLNGFIKKYFNSGIRFERDENNKDKRSEPSFLERNWLMHGMTKRDITENDCIKLFNAICSLHYLLQTLFKVEP